MIYEKEAYKGILAYSIASLIAGVILFLIASKFEDTILMAYSLCTAVICGANVILLISKSYSRFVDSLAYASVYLNFAIFFGRIIWYMSEELFFFLLVFGIASLVAFGFAESCKKARKALRESVRRKEKSEFKF